MRTVRLSLKAARTALEALGESSRFGASQALVELRSALSKASRASTTRRTLRKPKEAKHKAKREARQEVRAAVMARANGACEACGSRSPSLELDHFFGRARSESVETCWALGRRCHREKTDNDPSAAWWLQCFAHHCDQYRYTEAEARARKRLAWVELRDSQAGGGAP